MYGRKDGTPAFHESRQRYRASSVSFALLDGFGQRVDDNRINGKCLRIDTRRRGTFLLNVQLTGDPESLDPLAQSGARDAENLRCLELIPAC